MFWHYTDNVKFSDLTESQILDREISHIGYMIQCSQGIANPSASTIKAVESDKEKLRVALLKLKEKDPRDYSQYQSVMTYERLLTKKWPKAHHD